MAAEDSDHLPCRALYMIISFILYKKLVRTIAWNQWKTQALNGIWESAESAAPLHAAHLLR
jgi:hypothetical protein